MPKLRNKNKEESRKNGNGEKPRIDIEFDENDVK